MLWTEAALIEDLTKIRVRSLPNYYRAPSHEEMSGVDMTQQQSVNYSNNGQQQQAHGGHGQEAMMCNGGSDFHGMYNQQNHNQHHSQAHQRVSGGGPEKRPYPGPIQRTVIMRHDVKEEPNFDSGVGGVKKEWRSPCAVANNSNGSPNPNGQPTYERRGPGRPRKNPPPDPNKPKRGPGRPRKCDQQIDASTQQHDIVGLSICGNTRSSSLDSMASSPDVYPVVKRGPGRPRKPPTVPLEMARQMYGHHGVSVPAEISSILGHPSNQSVEDSIEALKELLAVNNYTNDITVDGIRAEATMTTEESAPSSAEPSSVGPHDDHHQIRTPITPMAVESTPNSEVSN